MDTLREDCFVGLKEATRCHLVNLTTLCDVSLMLNSTPNLVATFPKKGKHNHVGAPCRDDINCCTCTYVVPLADGTKRDTREEDPKSAGVDFETVERAHGHDFCAVKTEDKHHAMRRNGHYGLMTGTVRIDDPEMPY